MPGEMERRLPSGSDPPELLSCPEEAAPVSGSEPLRFLYTAQHEVWLWDGESGAHQPIPLPVEAAYPSISPDGRFIAYLENEKAYSMPELRVTEIPVWLYDRQTGQESQFAAFTTDALHERFPEAPISM